MTSARAVRLREADEADAAPIAALWTEAYAQAGPEGRQEPYALQEYFAVAAAARVTVAVAEDTGHADADADHAAASDGDDAVVGVVALFPPGSPGRSVAGPGEAELARLAVAARARRQGIGHALVATAVEQARGYAAEAVVLWSRPHQTAAHALYESLGWRRIAERDGEDREGRRWVFRLDL